MENVTAASLMPWKAWNDGPETDSRNLYPTEEQLGRLIWAVWMETPYSRGGLPYGGPMRNVRITAVFDARTGAVLGRFYGVGQTEA